MTSAPTHLLSVLDSGVNRSASSLCFLCGVSSSACRGQSRSVAASRTPTALVAQSKLCTSVLLLS